MATSKSAAVKPTVLDDVAVDSMRRGLGPAASIGSWDKLARAASDGKSPALVSAGRLSWPARPDDDSAIEAALASSAADRPYPGGGRYRRDEHTARIALEYLRAHEPRLLHVGLGDTDEYGHRGDYVAYLAAIRAADVFIAALAREVLSPKRNGTIIVTTDHGRDTSFRNHGSAFPRSGRSFILAFGPASSSAASSATTAT